MKTLDRLIQISSFELDKARQALLDLESRRGALEEAVAGLDDRIAAEMQAAAQDAALSTHVGPFLTAVRARQAALRDAITELEPDIDAARDAVSEAYRENRRYQHVRDQRHAETRRQRARAEQATMDEIGLALARGE